MSLLRYVHIFYNEFNIPRCLSSVGKSRIKQKHGCKYITHTNSTYEMARMCTNMEEEGNAYKCLHTHTQELE